MEGNRGEYCGILQGYGRGSCAAHEGCAFDELLPEWSGIYVHFQELKGANPFVGVGYGENIMYDAALSHPILNTKLIILTMGSFFELYSRVT